MELLAADAELILKFGCHPLAEIPAAAAAGSTESIRTASTVLPHRRRGTLPGVIRQLLPARRDNRYRQHGWCGTVSNLLRESHECSP
jgi:hypothetical protein